MSKTNYENIFTRLAALRRDDPAPTIAFDEAHWTLPGSWKTPDPGMSDELTLNAAQCSGHYVTNDDGDVVCAGTLEDCQHHMAAHFEVLAAKKEAAAAAAEQAELRAVALKLREQQVEDIRKSAQDQVNALRAAPVITR